MKYYAKRLQCQTGIGGNVIAQDSAKFWFPKLNTDPWLRTMMPNTIMIDYNEEALAQSLHGKHTEEYDRLYYAVEAAVRYEIGYPAFLRTDITSAKHAGKAAWYLGSDDDLNGALLTTLSAAQLKCYFQKVKPSAIMVRSFIPLKYERTAFGGLPIAREWRVFAESGVCGAQCIHGYWPTEALEGHMDDTLPPEKPESDKDNWFRRWLPSEASDAAVRAASLMGKGKWSVDFAEGEDGKLWLLDMATAGNSYHAKECLYWDLDKENSL